MREGRENDYHGIAIHPRHLSLYKRVVLKRNRNYNPELDKRDKIQEMRALYKAMNEGSSKEEPDGGFAESVSDKVSAYFAPHFGKCYLVVFQDEEQCP